MSKAAGQRDVGVARELRNELRGAGDAKIRQIIAVVDASSDPTVNETLLGPLRFRLAGLRQARPLRFSRLLFIPLDPIIVPARGWKSDEPTVPRTTLTALSDLVRAGVGSEMAAINSAIAGSDTSDQQAITDAGKQLWPRAAEILVAAKAPDNWAETGVPVTKFESLARAIAAVLRRAVSLRELSRDREVGALQANQKTVDAILRDITTESPLGGTMMARLLLEQAPHAAPLLAAFMGASGQSEKAVLRKAMATAAGEALAEIEGEGLVTEEVSQAALSKVGDNIRRMVTLLREIEQCADGTIPLPRLKAARDNLDQACQQRFTTALNESLMTPLNTASAPVDSGGQVQLESSARDLRKLETAARQIGGSTQYDAMLQKGAAAVLAAARSGTLSKARHVRLMELLVGPEAAEELVRTKSKR